MEAEVSLKNWIPLRDADHQIKPAKDIYRRAPARLVGEEYDRSPGSTIVVGLPIHSGPGSVSVQPSGCREYVAWRTYTARFPSAIDYDSILKVNRHGSNVAACLRANRAITENTSCTFVWSKGSAAIFFSTSKWLCREEPLASDVRSILGQAGKIGFN